MLAIFTFLGTTFFAMFLVIVICTFFTFVAIHVARETYYLLFMPAVSLHVVGFPTVVACSCRWCFVVAGRGQGGELLLIPRILTVRVVVTLWVVVCRRGAREVPHQWRRRFTPGRMVIPGMLVGGGGGGDVGGSRGGGMGTGMLVFLPLSSWSKDRCSGDLTPFHSELASRVVPMRVASHAAQ